MPLVRIFNPTEMVVQATVDEPDFAAISSAKTARVYLDAYSGEMFTATLQSATPLLQEESILRFETSRWSSISIHRVRDCCRICLLRSRSIVQAAALRPKQRTWLMRSPA